MIDRTPNRLLDLQEMEDPFFRRPVLEMEELCGRENISYLHPSKRWEYPWALERARLSPGARVLDAGCGASIFPVYLARRGFRVSAFDLHPPRGLDRLHGVEIDYRRADLGSLPFESRAFDAVFCISVIEHLPLSGIAPALEELRRVLRPGGRLLLTTDYYRDASARVYYEGEGESFPVDWNVFDEERLRRHILEAPGFEVEGEVDLQADWEEIAPRMRRFHGYPYTAVGVCLVNK